MRKSHSIIAAIYSIIVNNNIVDNYYDHKLVNPLY